MMNPKAFRFPLLANAMFSLGGGLLLIFGSADLGRWLGPDVGGLYVLLGFGLTLFAFSLLLLARRPTPLIVLMVTAADIAWIISTSGALLIWRSEFTTTGVMLILATNGAVAALAWLQERAIRRAFRAAGGTSDEFDVCIAVNAPVPADAFWKVLSRGGSTISDGRVGGSSA